MFVNSESDHPQDHMVVAQALDPCAPVRANMGLPPLDEELQGKILEYLCSNLVNFLTNFSQSFEEVPICEFLLGGSEATQVCDRADGLCELQALEAFPL